MQSWITENPVLRAFVSISCPKCFSSLMLFVWLMSTWLPGLRSDFTPSGRAPRLPDSQASSSPPAAHMLPCVARCLHALHSTQVAASTGRPGGKGPSLPHLTKNGLFTREGPPSLHGRSALWSCLLLLSLWLVGLCSHECQAYGIS